MPVRSACSATPRQRRLGTHRARLPGVVLTYSRLQRHVRPTSATHISKTSTRAPPGIWRKPPENRSIHVARFTSPDWPQGTAVVVHQLQHPGRRCSDTSVTSRVRGACQGGVAKPRPSLPAPRERHWGGWSEVPSTSKRPSTGRSRRSARLYRPKLSTPFRPMRLPAM